MNLRPLPVGIQDFAHLRERNCVYVDKTELVHQLVAENTAVFLSRPRRFGKSLLISILKELFEGNQKLFEGLWIHDHWDWSIRRPVVRISFGSGKFQQRGDVIQAQLAEVSREAQRWDVQLHSTDAHRRFAELLAELTRRGPRPVVLIDEYDKPILQCLENFGRPSLPNRDEGDLPFVLEAREEELSVLEDNRQQLRGFYSVLKDASPEFLLLTGVSRLAKASVFSELNHLQDITWGEAYAALCGITQTELERDFKPHLEAMAARQKLSLTDLLDRLRKDYNGFRFAAGDDVPTVHNPFSTCRCLSERAFGSYWTETGTPEFLVRLMKNSDTDLPQVEGVLLPTRSLASLDPDRPEPLPLLLQTGYLTITGWADGYYRLGFPNQEVRAAFLDHLLQVVHDRRFVDISPRAQAMAKALLKGDLERFLSEMKRVFTGIAYQLDDAHEKRYHGLFQALCNLALNPPGLVLAEVPNALGRSDLVVDLPDACWIFEFKRDTDTVEALEQIAQKEYENQWEGRVLPDGSPKPVYWVAITFGTDRRSLSGAEGSNIVAWERREG